MRILVFMLLLLVPAAAAEVKLGKPLALKQTTPIAALVAQPQNYVGKTVQVKGKATGVCQMMGCWINLADSDGKMVRIKVKDGEIEFPKDAVGKTVVAEGQFTKIEMTKEQNIAAQKHEAEENNRKFDPASVTGGTTVYQVAGSGAVILE